MVGPVNTWTGHCLRAGKPSHSQYVTSHPSTQPSTLRGMAKRVSAFCKYKLVRDIALSVFRKRPQTYFYWQGPN